MHKYKLNDDFEKEIENARINDDDKEFGGNREKALIRDNFKCQICGINQLQQVVLYGSSLSVHHKDFKGMNVPRKERNNELTNLTTLCTSCHTTLHQQHIRELKILAHKK